MTEQSADEIFGEVEGDYKPTLHQVRQFFAARCLPDAKGRPRTPLIGEAPAALQAFLAFVMSERPVLVLAYSGTGKTVLVDAVMDLIPPEERHSIQLGSETSLWYKMDEINRARFVEIPEVQKTVQNLSVVEVLKNWGEGKAAHRDVTDIISNVQGGDPTAAQVLNWHPFITSCAIGNKAAKPIIEDDEFMRRVLEIRTDPSAEMTKQVVAYKLRQWGTLEQVETFSDYEMELLKQHVADVIFNGPMEFFNPGAVALEGVVPTALPVSRSFVDNLISICNAVTRFYYRDCVEQGGKYFVRPADIYEASRIYIQDFIEGCFKLPLLGREILGAMPTHEESLAESVDDEVPQHAMVTASQLASLLEGEGYNIDLGSVRRILALLVMNHFVKVMEDGKTKRYYRSTHSADFANRINWQQLVKACRDNADNDEYAEKFCGSSIAVIDPITGERVDLMKLEDKKVEKKKIEVTEVLKGLDNYDDN